MKEKWRKALAFLKAPPRWVIAVCFSLTPVFVALSLLCVFLGAAGIFSYSIYALSACALAYAVYLLVRLAPQIKGWGLGTLRRGKFTRELTENYGFRTLVFAGFSLLINFGFVLFNAVFAILTKNIWYGSLAGYYFLLGGVRGCVFWWERRARKRACGDEEYYRRLQWKNYGNCGVALLVLNFALSVAVTLMVLDQKPTKYSEITAIVFAAYTVYKIFFAVHNIFKAKKGKDLQIRSFRNIGLVDAAVSLLSLQTALVATFSTEGEDMLALNAVVGAAVCITAVAIAVVMLAQKRKRRNCDA